MNKIFDILEYRINKFLVETQFNYLAYEESDEEKDLYRENWDRNISLKKQADKKNNISIKIILDNQSINRVVSRKMKSSKEIMQPAVANLLTRIERTINLNNDAQSLNYFNFSFSSDDKIVNFTSKENAKFTKNILKSYGLGFVTNQNMNRVSDTSFSLKYSKDILISKSKNHLCRNLNIFDYYSTDNNLHDELVSSEYLHKNLNFKNSIRNFIPSLPSQEGQTEEEDNEFIFEKIINFQNLPITQENQANLIKETGLILVGFLIKKHIKSKEGDISLNVANQFLQYDISDTILKTELNFYDEYVSYGSSYSYEVFPVFCLTLPKNNDGYYEKFYYLVCCQSYKTLFTRSVDYVQPSTPNALRAKFLYNLGKAELYWDYPNDTANDIIGYQIYRRRNLDEPYQLVGMNLKKDTSKFRNFEMFSEIIDSSVHINIDKFEKAASTRFIDDIDNFNNLYIYSVCSIDAHGMISNYSNQIALRYSNIYNKLIIDSVSLADAPRQYPNLYIKRKSILFENDNLIFNFTPFFKNKEKIKIYLTPDYQTISLDKNIEGVSVFEKDATSSFHLNVTRLTDLNVKNFKLNLN